MPSAFICSVFNTCGGIDFLQYWTIRCRIQVSYMYQMYRESLGGISAVSQLALMSLVCAVSRPPGPTYPIPNPTLLACTTPTTAYYPYHRPLLATTPTTPTYYLLALLPLLPLLTTPTYYPLLPTPLIPLVPGTAYYPYPPTYYPLLPLCPYYPLRTVPLLPLLPPATPLLPLLSSTPTTQREVHVSCMYSVSVVLVLCMIFDVFLRACIGAWIVFFLDVS